MSLRLVRSFEWQLYLLSSIKWIIGGQGEEGQSYMKRRRREKGRVHTMDSAGTLQVAVFHTYYLLLE